MRAFRRVGSCSIYEILQLRARSSSHDLCKHVTETHAMHAGSGSSRLARNFHFILLCFLFQF